MLVFFIKEEEFLNHFAPYYFSAVLIVHLNLNVYFVDFVLYRLKFVYNRLYCNCLYLISIVILHFRNHQFQSFRVAY